MSRRKFSSARLDGGAPLGGIGTGYSTLEGKGLIGHCSIFNDIVPPRADFSEWLTVMDAGGESLPLSNADFRLLGAPPTSRNRAGNRPAHKRSRRLDVALAQETALSAFMRQLTSV